VYTIHACRERGPVRGRPRDALKMVELESAKILKEQSLI
jgi:hypothetical protein